MTERQNELHVKCLHLRPDRRTVTLSLTEPLWNNMLVMLLRIHHRPKCFSDKKLRNLMPWFCREFAAIFVTFFNCLPRFLAFFTAIFFWPYLFWRQYRPHAVRVVVAIVTMAERCAARAVDFVKMSTIPVPNCYVPRAFLKLRQAQNAP